MNGQIRHKDLVSGSARLAFERVVAATARADPSRPRLARTPPAARAGRAGRARAGRGRRARRHRRRRARSTGRPATSTRSGSCSASAASCVAYVGYVLAVRDTAKVDNGPKPQLRRLGAERCVGGFGVFAATQDERRLRGRLLGAAKRRRGPRRGGRARARPGSARVRDPRAGGALLRDRDHRERRGRARSALTLALARS